MKNWSMRDLLIFPSMLPDFFTSIEQTLFLFGVKKVFRLYNDYRKRLQGKIKHHQTQKYY
jgi:hypothetical protein